MNILEVNYSDLPGRTFNGFDLHLALNAKGVICRQLVKVKKSDIPTVGQFQFDPIIDFIIRYEEERHSIKNILYPFAADIMAHPFYQEADVVHYHILHNDVISLFDYPLLMNDKKSVWTLHDPWIFTGNCIHPFECQKWKTGCGECSNPEPGFRIRDDNTECMWQIKKEVLAQVNPWIVVASDFMKRFVETSPLTSHWGKIMKIPFGIDIDRYKLSEHDIARASFSLSKDDFVIGFRESDYIKGCEYIYDALRKYCYSTKNIILLTVGGAGLVPDDIKSRFRTVELGWVNDSSKMIQFFLASDVFLMPSLAESFGLMSIEAMAAETPVICFKETVLEEITAAPDIGIAVEYKSSKGILTAIIDMIEHPDERKKRAASSREHVLKNYLFEDYVQRHIQLYEKVLSE